jgi:hypothetical protein
MEKRWWEGPASFLADWWWLIVLVIAIALTAYFTRGLWLAALI